MSEPGKDVVHVTPMPIAKFGDETVRKMVAKLPSITREMDYGYPRNTYLRIEVDARVQSVLVDEIKSGLDKGQLYMQHNLAIEGVRIIGVFTAEQMEEGVGGSASAAAVEQEEADERERADRQGADQPGAPGGAVGEEGPWDPGF